MPVSIVQVYCASLLYKPTVPVALQKRNQDQDTNHKISLVRPIIRVCGRYL